MSKEIEDLNGTIVQKNLTFIEHPSTTAECTFFFQAPMKDHMFGQKTNVNKLKRIKIIQSMFADHYGI